MSVAAPNTEVEQGTQPPADTSVRWGLLVAAGGALVAAVLAIAITRHGMSDRSDSALYLGTAQNLLDGRGLTSPLTLVFSDYFTPLQAFRYHGALPLTALPPLYSLLIAGVAWFGMSVATASRVLGVVALATSTFLIGVLMLRLAGRAWGLVLAAIALFLAAGPLYQLLVLPGSWLLLSATVLSEVLFLSIVLAGLLALASLLERGDRVSLCFTALATAAALLSRYLGVALLLTAAIMIVSQRSWSWSTRVRRLAFVGVVAVLPLVVWRGLLRALVGQGKSQLPLRYHGLDSTTLTDGLKNIVHWFVPDTVPLVIASALVVVLGLAVVAMAIASARGPDGWVERRGAGDGPRLALVVAVFVGVYLVCVLLSRLLVVLNVGFDVRFLAVVRPLVYVLLLSIIYRFLRRYGTLVATALIAVGCLLVIAPQLGDIADLVDNGPPSRPHSATATAVRGLPTKATIITNLPDVVWLNTGRASIIAPIKRVPESGLANRRYRADTRQVGELLRRPNSYLVMFRTLFGGVLANASDLERAIPLRPVAEFADGTIYVRKR